MDYKAIGRRVQHLRKAQRLTQEQLAEMAGISLSFMGHIERGSRKMSMETLFNIASTLNCTSDYLIGLNRPPLSAYQMALRRMGEWIEEELASPAPEHENGPIHNQDFT